MVSAIAPPAAEAPSPGRARRFRALIWGFCLLLVLGTWWFVIGQVRFERDQAIEDMMRRNANRVPGPLSRINVANHPAVLAHLVRADDQLYISQPIYSQFVQLNMIWLSR